MSCGAEQPGVVVSVRPFFGGVPLVGVVRKGSVGLGEKLPQWKETGKGTEAGKSSVWVSEQQGQREKGHAKEDSPGQVPRDVGEGMWDAWVMA